MTLFQWSSYGVQPGCPAWQDDSVGLSPLCLRASKCLYNSSTFNTYQQDALTTVHIPILHATEMQYFRDHPAASLSTPNPAPFKLPRCVPRTAAADGKSNAIRLFLKHKKGAWCWSFQKKIGEINWWVVTVPHVPSLMLDAGVDFWAKVA